MDSSPYVQIAGSERKALSETKDLQIGVPVPVYKYSVILHTSQSECIEQPTEFPVDKLGDTVNKRECHVMKPDTFLCYIIVFGLDPAQATIGLKKCWSN